MCPTVSFGLQAARLVAAWGGFVGDEAAAAVAAVTDALDSVAGMGAGVKDGEMGASAVAAAEAVVFVAGGGSWFQALLLFCFCISANESRLRRPSVWPCPGSRAPEMLAATAVPTRQSSQWLSRSGMSFHSSTALPFASTWVGYSEVS